MLDLIRAGERLVDLFRKLGAGIGWVKRLVGIHRAADVGIGRHLPAAEVDRLKAGADHLHRLVARESAEGADGFVLVEKLPQLQRAAARERVLDRDRSAQLQHIVNVIRPLDPIESACQRCDHLPEIAHCALPVCRSRRETHRTSKSRSEKSCYVKAALVFL